MDKSSESNSIMQQPLVSVLIPVYNVEPFLGECIDSIINQTYHNLQVVLIDDGSKDRSWQIMQDYAARDERIEVYSQPNCGVAETRNRLLDKARGEFVVFVDSDDWIELNAVELLIKEQNAQSNDIVSFQTLEAAAVDDDVYDRETAVRKFLEHKSFRGSLCTKLIRRQLFDGLSFNSNFSYGEDALMCWQLVQKINSVRLLPNRLYHYRWRPVSLSRATVDDRKFTAYYVWRQISDDTERLWPQYQDIAHARYAIEMTLLVRKSAYKGCTISKQSISKMQKVIKAYCADIGKTQLSSRKMQAIAWLAARSYPLAKFLLVKFKL